MIKGAVGIVAVVVAFNQRSSTHSTKPSNPASQETNVEGILLATGDAQLVKRTRKDFRLAPASELARVFPSSRFEIVPWDNRRRIVLDRTSGPMARTLDRLMLTRGIAKKMDAHGTLDVSSMSDDEYRAAQALFGSWPTDSETRRTIEPTAFGIEREYIIDLKSGGTTRNFRMAVPDPQSRAMRGALRQRILNVERMGLTRQGRRIRTDELPPQDEYDLLFIGSGRRDTSEGMRLLAEAVQKLDAKASREAQDAGRNLLKSLGADSGGSEGEMDAERMPRALRNALRDQLSEGWQGLGFSSREEALSFLKSADSFRAETSLSLRQTISIGDPDRNIPSVGAGREFLIVSGAYLP